MPKKAGKIESEPSTPSTSIPPAAPRTLNDGFPLPKMIVFDLDYTLWPFWVDTHVTPPLKPSKDNTYVQDRFGESFRFYQDVPSIIVYLQAKKIKIGAASRTGNPDLAREMLKLLHIYSPGPNGGGKGRKAIEYFEREYQEIYPGNKMVHFNMLIKKTGLRGEDMLFFDDEPRNKNVETLGVHMQLVRDGVTRDEIDKGITEWRRKNAHPVKSETQVKEPQDKTEPQQGHASKFSE